MFTLLLHFADSDTNKENYFNYSFIQVFFHRAVTFDNICLIINTVNSLSSFFDCLFMLKIIVIYANILQMPMSLQNVYFDKLLGGFSYAQGIFPNRGKPYLNIAFEWKHFLFFSTVTAIIDSLPPNSGYF